MSKQSFRFSPSILAILFACAAIPAFAQRGGGGSHGMGGGGGFHGGGGGGFHGGGGGFHSGVGGGSRPVGGGGVRGGVSGPPLAGYAGPRSAPITPQRPGAGYSPRPGVSYPQPYGNFAGGNQRMGNSFSAPPAVADGHWHSFAGPAGNQGSSGRRPEAVSPVGGADAWHVFGGNHSPSMAGPARSFSGQGREVWENAPLARNVIPSSQALSRIRGSFQGASNANPGAISRGPASGLGLRVGSGSRPGLQSSTSLFASSRFAGQSSVFRNRGFSSSLNTTPRHIRNPIGTDPRFDRFHGSCWNCGFGWGWGGWGWSGWGWGGGLGWGWGPGWAGGFGWPWYGFGNPFWYNPWSWSWGWPGYGYYGYAPVYLYSSLSSPYSYGNSPSNSDYQNSTAGQSGNSSSTPPAPEVGAPAQESTEANSITGNLTVPVLLYMRDGSVYTVRDYWLTGNDFHFVLLDGEDKSVDVGQVDLRRTNDENAKSGVKFILKSEPNLAPAPSDENSVPPAKPDTEQPGSQPENPDATPGPSPTQQIEASPEPEART
jgi:hypothetical protein